MALAACGWTRRSPTLGRLVVPLVCRNRATSSGRGGSNDGSPWAAHKLAFIPSFEQAMRRLSCIQPTNTNKAYATLAQPEDTAAPACYTTAGAALRVNCRSMPARAWSRTRGVWICIPPALGSNANLNAPASMRTRFSTSSAPTQTVPANEFDPYHCIVWSADTVGCCALAVETSMSRTAKMRESY